MILPSIQYSENLHQWSVNVPVNPLTPVILAGVGLVFAIVSGSLPDGIVLDPVTGSISGTPTSDGSYNVTVRGANALGNDDVEMTLNVAAESIALTRKAGAIGNSVESGGMR